jgi:hypothetical protein
LLAIEINDSRWNTASYSRNCRKRVPWTLGVTSSTKYIGVDVHKEGISIAVRNAAGT